MLKAELRNHDKAPFRQPRQAMVYYISGSLQLQHVVIDICIRDVQMIADRLVTVS